MWPVVWCGEREHERFLVFFRFCFALEEEDRPPTSTTAKIKTAKKRNTAQVWQWLLAFVRGHGIIPISGGLDRFRPFLKWDYGVLGGLTPVISWCCILCYDHA